MYLVWYDDSPKKSLRDKIDEAIERFQGRFGVAPDQCLVNEASVVEHPRLTVRAVRHARPHYFWVGRDDLDDASTVRGPGPDAAGGPAKPARARKPAPAAPVLVEAAPRPIRARKSAPPAVAAPAPPAPALVDMPALLPASPAPMLVEAAAPQPARARKPAPSAVDVPAPPAPVLIEAAAPRPIRARKPAPSATAIPEAAAPAPAAVAPARPTRIRKPATVAPIVAAALVPAPLPALPAEPAPVKPDRARKPANPGPELPRQTVASAPPAIAARRPAAVAAPREIPRQATLFDDEPLVPAGLAPATVEQDVAATIEAAAPRRAGRKQSASTLRQAS